MFGLQDPCGKIVVASFMHCFYTISGTLRQFSYHFKSRHNYIPKQKHILHGYRSPCLKQQPSLLSALRIDVWPQVNQRNIIFHCYEYILLQRRTRRRFISR